VCSLTLAVLLVVDEMCPAYSRENWARCLVNGVCPFTKKQLRKRDLVSLTLDNIEQYRDKIVNWLDKDSSNRSATQNTLAASTQ